MSRTGCIVELEKRIVELCDEVERLRAAFDLSEEYNSQKDGEIDRLRVLAVDLYECAVEGTIELERESFLQRAPWLEEDAG